MRLVPVIAAIALTACSVQAQDPAGVEWRLLALDGQIVDMPATLSIETDGRISARRPATVTLAKIRPASPT